MHEKLKTKMALQSQQSMWFNLVAPYEIGLWCS